MNKQDLSHYIRTYPNSLSADFCRSVVEHFESSPQLQQANGRDVRPGLEHSQWRELDLTHASPAPVRRWLSDLVTFHYSRYVSELQLTLPVSPPTRMSNLIVKRYSSASQDAFQPHFDSLGEVCRRYLVLLWYLNDVPTGGETEFVDLDISVRPEVGKLLMFPPYWMFQHAGRKPVGADKYIVSGYLEY